MNNTQSLAHFRQWLIAQIGREKALGDECWGQSRLHSTTVHYQKSATLQHALTNFDLAMRGEFAADSFSE